MNPKQKTLLLGAAGGAALGALAGYLFARGLDRSAEVGEEASLTRRSVPPTELIKLAVAVIGVLRIVAELGERG